MAVEKNAMKVKRTMEKKRKAQAQKINRKKKIKKNVEPVIALPTHKMSTRYMSAYNKYSMVYNIRKLLLHENIKISLGHLWSPQSDHKCPSF